MKNLINLIKNYIDSIKYHFYYLGVLNSPFVGLKLEWYFGNIEHSVPYFLPRKWVKMTKKDCEEALQKDIETLLPKYVEGRTWKDYKNYKKPVPIKWFGFNSCELGWKLKWDEVRYEYSPCYSLVLFGKQLYVKVLPKVSNKLEAVDSYWEAWITYDTKTDETKSEKERLEHLFKIYGCTWIIKDKSKNYYEEILKNYETNI
jgi:hypothetical protein